MFSVPSRLVLLGLCLLIAPGCGGDAQDAPEQKGESASAAEAERQQRRENEAAQRLRVARGSAPAAKAAALGEVAHLFWDTDAGADAVVTLVEFLMRKGDPEPALALREIETYRQAAGNNRSVLTASELLAQNLASRLELADDDGLKAEEKAELASLCERSRALWIDVVLNMIKQPEYAADLVLHRSLGDARLAERDFEAAALAWAQVEKLDPPAVPAERIKVLLNRAALVKHQLMRVDEARTLFTQAQELLGKLDDPQARRHYADYIAEELGE